MSEEKIRYHERAATKGSKKPIVLCSLTLSFFDYVMKEFTVRIHMLAPSNRPVQVTENLEVFWRETYPKLKQELQRKYPKHEWR